MMTTEKLKPFIPVTTNCVDSTPSKRPNEVKHSKRTPTNFNAILLSALVVIWTLILLGFMIWHFQRVSHLETDISHLNTLILNMQKRLGITNLDDFGDYGKEYNHAFIDEEDNEDINEHNNKDDDDDDDDEDEDEEFDYEELRKLAAANYYESNSDDEDEVENHDDIIDSTVDEDGGEEDANVGAENEEDDMDVSDDGDLYNDFSKFNATRKKKTSSRKPREIVQERPTAGTEKKEKFEKDKSDNDENEIKSKNQERRMLSLRLPSQRTEAPGRQSKTSRRSHKRILDNRKYKNDIVKKAKSTRQMQTMAYTPAAHFHLHRKVPDRYTSIRIDSYSGDMYIGHPSWSNEINVDNYFRVENGVLAVLEAGLYYVYAQVCYNNTHDQNGFVVFHGHKPFLQCLNTVPTNIPHKIHTCHTSGLIYLKENETIHLRDFHSDRNAILRDANNRSYFGLIKI